MANKEALRALQSRLAERLQAAQTEPRSVGWLAVEAAGHRFLLPLADAGEIFQPSGLIPVPHTRDWFVGVANLRGTLAGVVDLAGFLALRADLAPPQREQGHLIAFNPALDINAALRVDRLAGLRNREQLVADPVDLGAERPAFAGAVYRDSEGRAWQEISLTALARDEHFLRITHGG
jgi:twitching motility protein PilI